MEAPDMPGSVADAQALAPEQVSDVLGSVEAKTLAREQARTLAGGLDAIQARHARELRAFLEDHFERLLSSQSSQRPHSDDDSPWRQASVEDPKHEQTPGRHTQELHTQELPGAPASLTSKTGRGSSAWDGGGLSGLSMLPYDDAWSDTTIDQLGQQVFAQKARAVDRGGGSVRSLRDMRIKGVLAWLVSHHRYETAVGVLILMNAVIIAWEAEWTAQAFNAGEYGHKDDRPAVFVALMYLFCVVFVVDLVARITVHKMRFFCNGNGVFSKDNRWNLFDTCCVLGYLIEVTAESLDEDSGLLRHSSLLRVARLARVLRIFHVLRAITVFRDLRIMVASLCDSVIPLVWFGLIVFLVLMSVGIVFTNATVDHFVSNPNSDGDHEALRKYYSTLFTTMMSLFKAITGGVDWQDVVEPLDQLSGTYTAIFFAFISFSMFAMINVGSAIFLDTVLQRSKNDRDFVIETTTQEKKIFMRTMDHLFSELDKDKSGQISLQELRWHLSNHEVATFLSALNLDVNKVTQLFHLMDSNGSGTIDRFEFREGCHKLRGEAKQLDLAILHAQVKAMQRRVSPSVASADGVDRNHTEID